MDARNGLTKQDVALHNWLTMQNLKLKADKPTKSINQDKNPEDIRTQE